MKTALSPIDKKFHDEFSSYGLRAKEWMRKCVILLPEIERREICLPAGRQGRKKVFRVSTNTQQRLQE